VHRSRSRARVGPQVQQRVREHGRADMHHGPRRGRVPAHPRPIEPGPEEKF